MTELTSFGEWLKRQRMGRGLTREQLAHQIGCAVVTLRKIEAEERRPSAQIVERLAEILNIPQDQNTTFLRFARGDWRSTPMGVPENYPWLQREADEASQPAIHLATFLFTDIEGSARLWEQAPEKMKVALQRHHEILQEAITSNGGAVFQIVGDAFCAAFPTVLSAVSAAVIAQRELYQEQWDLPFPIRVRMGIHTGEAEQTGDNPLLGGYASNQTLNRAARILSAGYGGQVLLSLATTDLVKDSLPANTELRDMGEHHLRNLIHPEHLFQLNISGLPTEFPPLNTLTHRTNLPIEMTSFIGRENEQAAIIDLLSKNRLVTLTGAGGIGKMRLSLQVGQKLLGGFQNGTWFVELAPILDPLLVPRTTAIAIGLRDEPLRPVIDMLCDYLRDKKVLIILDNCEHLIDACVSMTDKLLRAASHVHILASSREALGISGAVNYRVPSLGLPDVEHLPPVESLSQFEAITLFVERARSAVSNFVMTSENASALAQICYRLDGIPLAIELAAAKVHVLSVEQIAKRLDDRFRLLTSGSRVALERHQTLRAAIDWSYNLLSPPEQILFRRVSVFVGGWTLEAAESLCADEMVKSDDVLNLLEQLINKSLVITDTSQGESRYYMLETLRQYSNEKRVEAGESDTLRDKHLEYFLNLAETADPHLRRTEQIEWLKRLDAEIENLRAALTWAMGKSSAESALRLAGNLGDFWNLSLYWLEGAQWLDQALNKEWNKKNEAEKATRARALYRRAGIAGEIDELDIMKTASESALVLCEEVQDSWGVAFSSSLIAYSQQRLGMPRASIKFDADQCLNEFRRLGDAWGESWILFLQTMMLLDSGPREEYLEIMERCLTRARDSGDRYQMAFSRVGLATDALNHSEWDKAERLVQEVEKLYGEITFFEVGTSTTGYLRTHIFFARGNFEEAKVEARRMIEYCDRIGERNLQSIALSILALIAEAENDFQGAVVYAQKALALKREMGIGSDIVFGLMLVGIFKHKQGNVEAAMQYVRDSLEFVQRGEVGNRILINIFVYLGGLFVEKRAQVTTQILALSEALAQSFPVHRDPILDKPYFGRFVSAARAKLSEVEFASAWEAGSKMSLDEALDLALKALEEI